VASFFAAFTEHLFDYFLVYRRMVAVNHILYKDYGKVHRCSL